MKGPIVVRWSIALALVALFVPAFSAQDRFADLERITTAELAETQTPGAIVAVVQDDKVVYAKGIGIASVETGQPMTADMVFPIASMTKMYTATTLVSLAEEGKIDLAAPISRYIDRLPPRLGAVTAHQLLSHTAGFLDNAGISNRAYDDSTIDEQVRTYTDGIFFTDPGAVFSYANQGFNIAGLLVQQVSGMRYSQAVQARVFQPLGMSHSTFSLAMAATWALSQTHVGPNGKPATVLRPMGVQAPWPVGGMFSTATDLARFAVMFMNGGRIGGSQVIPAAVVTRMSTPNVAVHSQVEGGQYGYGLIMFADRGVRLIEHGGTLAGSATDFVMAPDRHVAVIVFANRTSHLTRTVDKALEIALSLPPRGGRHTRWRCRRPRPMSTLAATPRGASRRSCARRAGSASGSAPRRPRSRGSRRTPSWCRFRVSPIQFASSSYGAPMAASSTCTTACARGSACRMGPCPFARGCRGAVS
jgi:CubicO group peptidase (beta-lactamase class C family)